MARLTALAGALLFHPSPVTSLAATVHPDHSVTLDWTLPADPSVVGITIFRDRLDSGETVTFILFGSAVTFTDASAVPHAPYRYWVHTRDAEGDLSEGVWVRVGSACCDGDTSEGWCVVAGARGAPAPGPALGGALLLAAAALVPRRRLRPGR